MWGDVHPHKTSCPHIITLSTFACLYPALLGFRENTQRFCTYHNCIFSFNLMRRFKAAHPHVQDQHLNFKQRPRNPFQMPTTSSWKQQNHFLLHIAPTVTGLACWKTFKEIKAGDRRCASWPGVRGCSSSKVMSMRRHSTFLPRYSLHPLSCAKLHSVSFGLLFER